MSLIEDCQENKKAVKAIENALRKIFRYSITYVDVLDSAVAEERGPRGGKRFKCNCCGELFAQKEIQVDHIETVIPLDMSLDTMTLADLYKRINCSVDNLQVVCKTCHKKKSAAEVKERARLRKVKKEMKE